MRGFGWGAWLKARMLVNGNYALRYRGVNKENLFCVLDTGQDRVQKVFFEGLHALKLLLVQQYLAAVSAGEEDGQRLLFLSCWYNRIIWRQSDVWERLYDPDNGARGFHQCKIFWERVRLAGLPTWTIY